jgi:hypothetical protein
MQILNTTGYVPLSGKNPLTSSLEGTTNIDGLLNSIFLWGIAIAVVVAIVSLAIAGFQYMLSDLVSNKQASVQRMKATALGLLLALGTWMILNTINPQILSSSLKFEALKSNVAVNFSGGVGGGKTDLEVSTRNENWLENSYLSNFSGSSAQQAVLEAAKYAADNKLGTCSVPNTNDGRMACAYAVNEIVAMATGSSINNSLSTVAMYSSLQKSPRFTYVGSDPRIAQPGDIIISPARPKQSGHVGIIETNNPNGNHTIISNSSNRASVGRHHTVAGWQKYYVTDRGLETHIFRAK